MPHFMLKRGDESPLAQAIRVAIGAGVADDVEVTTPEFDRPAGWGKPVESSRHRNWWIILQRLERADLRALGCRPFGLYTTTEPAAHVARRREAWFFEEDDKQKATHELWLFPSEWYRSIPHGFPVTSIFGEIEQFIPGHTDNDTRFGMLSFGLMLSLPPVQESREPRKGTD